MLIGTTAAYTYTSRHESATRDVYRTAADCQRDWGDPQSCERVSSGPQTGYYYGPTYGYGRYHDEGMPHPARAGTHAIATTHVPRGGFGGSASAHAAGS